MKNKNICPIEGCKNKKSGKYCSKHYRQTKKYGKIFKTTHERLLEINKNLDKSNWTPENIAWISGIIEGEGCFSWRKRDETGRIVISMTDEDVIQKLYNILKIGTLSKHKYHISNRKDTYILSINKYSDIIALVPYIIPWLGKRRTEKCLKILSNLKEKYGDNSQLIEYDKNDFSIENEENLAWIAGILEGEGSFITNKEKYNNRITVEMTDFDCLDNIYSIINKGRFYGPRIRKEGYKPIKMWGLFNKIDLIEFIPKILPYLCSRRTLAANNLMGIL